MDTRGNAQRLLIMGSLIAFNKTLSHTPTVVRAERASYWPAALPGVCLRCVTSAHGCRLAHMLNLPIWKAWRLALPRPSGHMSADVEHRVHVGTSSMSLCVRARVCVGVCVCVRVRHAHSCDCYSARTSHSVYRK